MCSFVFLIASLAIADAVDDLSPAQCARAPQELDYLLHACPYRRDADYHVTYAIVPVHREKGEWESE